MDVAVTGSSGLIGQALTAGLRRGGHRVLPIVRSGGGPGTIRWDPMEGSIDRAGLEGVDAVVHLAGEGIAAHRWTDAHRRRVRESRVRGTTLLAEALAGLDRRPSVLVSGSAIGAYGDRDDEVLTEASPRGNDFLAEVCRAWEEATTPAAEAGIRVATIRSGIVLSAHGGALAKQLLPFRLGLGAQAGRGDQWMSWISIDDEVGAIRFLIEGDLSGPVNLTAPAPVTNAEFTDAVGEVLRRPTFVRIPRAVTKLPGGVGDLAANLLFASQRVLPAALEGAGYPFRHRDLRSALRDVLGVAREVA
jgi:uncharacterized protein